MTVAVLEESARTAATLAPGDVRYEFYKGSGAGGQHRNKTESCVRAVHVPTGIDARAEGERSQHQNKRHALAALAAKVAREKKRADDDEAARARRRQVGSGQRGDKVRTVRVQDGVVTCERTGKKARLKDYLRGDLAWLA